MPNWVQNDSESEQEEMEGGGGGVAGEGEHSETWKDEGFPVESHTRSLSRQSAARP